MQLLSGPRNINNVTDFAVTDFHSPVKDVIFRENA